MTYDTVHSGIAVDSSYRSTEDLLHPQDFESTNADLLHNYQNAVECLINCEEMLSSLQRDVVTKDEQIARMEEEAIRTALNSLHIPSLEEETSQDEQMTSLIGTLEDKLVCKDEHIARLEGQLIAMSLELASSKANEGALEHQLSKFHVTISDNEDSHSAETHQTSSNLKAPKRRESRRVTMSHVENANDKGSSNDEEFQASLRDQRIEQRRGRRATCDILPGKPNGKQFWRPFGNSLTSDNTAPTIDESNTTLGDRDGHPGFATFLTEAVVPNPARQTLDESCHSHLSSITQKNIPQERLGIRTGGIPR